MTNSELNGEVINLKNKQYYLKYTSPEEFDLDNISQIHYENIMGELLTMPKVINDLGIMLAELDEYIKMITLELSIEKDNLTEIKAKLQPKSRAHCIDNRGIKSPTANDIESHLILQPEFQDQQTKIRELQGDLIQMEGQKERVNSVYWAAKYKLDNVKIIANIKPDQVDLMNGVINGINIQHIEKG